MKKTIFARKPTDLEQLKSDIADLKHYFHSEGTPYYVGMDLKLTKKEWASLTADLLVNRPYFKKFNARELPETEEGIPCVRITAPGSQIALIIDTQAYDYARYAGIETL